MKVSRLTNYKELKYQFSLAEIENKMLDMLGLHLQNFETIKTQHAFY